MPDVGCTSPRRARRIEADTERVGSRLSAENTRLRSTVTRLGITVTRLEAEQEQDAQWVAYELHDRLAQSVVSALQQVRILQGLTEPASPAQTVVDGCSLTLRKVLDELRSMMHSLQPPMLERTGLSRLIGATMREAARDSGWQVETDLDVAARLAHHLEVAIYRIISEALLNARWHANATKVSVSLTCDATAARGSVIDDGIGFDVAAVQASGATYGLSSMRRRAEILGGHCHIESEPGKGTGVHLWIPLQATA